MRGLHASRMRALLRQRARNGVAVIVLALSAASVAMPTRGGAQTAAGPPGDDSQTPTGQPGGTGMGTGAEGRGGGRRFGAFQPPAGGPRQLLEQRVRMLFERIVRQRLQLTDAQVARLRTTNQEFAPRRRDLATRERKIRQTMRTELRPGGVPDQARLATLMDSLFALQRERLDMLQAEQRELATFLSPAQRIRYYALQEQLRRRVEAMRQARLGALPPR